jgi:transposase-like protein
MVDEYRYKYLSKIERERFEAIERYSSIREAATSLDLSPQILYNWLYQFRLKYRKRRGWINSILVIRKKNNLLKKVLSERRPLRPMDDVDKVQDFLDDVHEQEREQEEEQF